MRRFHYRRNDYCSAPGNEAYTANSLSCRKMRYLLVLIVGLVWAGTLPDKTIIITNLAAPGAATVTNNGGHLKLRRGLIVEEKTNRTWRATNASCTVSNNCGEAYMSACRDMTPHATVTLVPWNGFSCSGQCEESCDKNEYLGPGTFRFVVVTCDGKQRFEGPAFELPAKRP